MAIVTTRNVHPTIGNHSWGLPLRVIQFVFAALVMSLSAYTLSKITGWREVRFTVAAVRSQESLPAIPNPPSFPLIVLPYFDPLPKYPLPPHTSVSFVFEVQS